MEDFLIGVYLLIGFLIGWFLTGLMIKKDFERKKPLDTLAQELAMMMLCWVLFTVAGMFWPLLVLWWALKKIMCSLEKGWF